MALKIVVDRAAGPKFKQNLAGIRDRFEAALTSAANMAASMIQNLARQDIAGAGFGPEWASGLRVEAGGTFPNMIISMTVDDPRVALFEKGGVIHGNPLLWIPLSGTDAEKVQAKDYPDGLFSAKSSSGTPLLFSISDKQPRYFGIEQVTIPQKFHLAEAQASVMANFRQIFDSAFKGG